MSDAEPKNSEARHVIKVRRKKRKHYFARVLLISLAAGFGAGFLGMKLLTGFSAAEESAASGGPSWLISLFGKNIPITGKSIDGSFVFSNFEREKEIRAWRRVSASLAQSDRFFADGNQSAKVNFHYRDEEFGAVILDDLVKSRRGLSDWSGYRELAFSVRNPQPREEILNLQIVDIRGQQFKAKFELPGSGDKNIIIPIERIAADIDITQVNQLSFYHRMREDKEFYLDSVRLTAGESFGAAGAGSYSSGAAAPFQTPGSLGTGRFATLKQAWARVDPMLPSGFVQIPVIVRNETKSYCFKCPVEGGIPFPQNELRDLRNLRLRNGFGEDLPFQPRVLSSWPDGSLKWVNLHFLTTLEPQEGQGFYLEYGPEIQTPSFPQGVQVEENDDAVVVDTGLLRTTLSKKRFSLFEKVLMDRNVNGLYEPHETVAERGEIALSFRGTEYRTDLDQLDYRLQIEEQGHQKVTLRASAWYVSERGDRFCQAIVRYTFHAAKSQIQLTHTLIYTGYPENKVFKPYQNLELPENEMIEQYGVRWYMPALSDKNLFATLGQAKTGVLSVNAGDNLSVLQTVYETLNIRNGNQPFAGGTPLIRGWLDVSDTDGGVTASLRNFQENFPKAYRFDSTAKIFEIDFWPEEAGPLDLSTTSKAEGPGAYGRGSAFGLAKSHDVVIYFHPDKALEAGSSHVGGSFNEPVIVRPNPYWVEATEAAGRLYPIDLKYGAPEQMLSRLFDWAERHPKNFRWYGMLDFGDTLTWWREKDETQEYGGFGWHPVGRWGWYNNEGVGLHTGALLQFLRGGDWRYFDFAENLTWHLMDIDTIHYNTIAKDPRLAGLLDEKYSQVGSMHRHNGDHWGGRSDEASHSNVFGILLYYFISGNERALEVAKEIGEFLLTKPITYAGHPDIAPARSIANVVWGDVSLYEATGDVRYKNGAAEMVQTLLRGQQEDGSFLENYNPVEDSWSGRKHFIYMSGYITGALISYHRMTGDGAVLEALLRLLRYLSNYDYAAQATLHGFAYAYLKTYDIFYLEQIQKHIPLLMKAQLRSKNPLLDGLIYQKPIYHRPMVYLSTVPYVFSALEEASKPREI